MRNGWAEERRKKQSKLMSELIHTWRPWEQSTGPKTPEGKARVSRNAFRGGVRPMLRELARVLREQDSQLEEL